MMSRRAGLVGMIALGMLAACAKKESASGDTTAVAGNTAAARTGSGATTSAAAAPAASLSDPNIVYLLDQANASDSARGHLAATKGTSADVKSFAKMMMGEHHALRQAGQQLAKKLNVTPQAPPNDQSETQARTEMDSLNAMAKGKAWDKAYIDYEVTYHQALKETATKALGAAQNQELKDLIQKAAPVVQKHLDRAIQVQQKLGS